MLRLKSLLPLLSLFPALAVQAQTAPISDSAHFTINQGSQAVGHADFAIQPIKQGAITTTAAYAVTSHGSLILPSTKYSFSASGTLGKDLAILSENLNGVVNGSAATFAVQTVGSNFVIDISANGRSYHNSLARPPQAVFFPDFDLAAYDILLNLAASHPGAPISALIPKQTGILSAATFAPQADVQATLNGAKLTVHHSSLTIGSVVSDLYYSRSNKIYEVDIPSETFAVVRDNFQLQQPPPPPPQTAPNGDQPDGAPPSNQLQ
jgi:hypothetical protein